MRTTTTTGIITTTTTNTTNTKTKSSKVNLSRNAELNNNPLRACRVLKGRVSIIAGTA